MACYKYWRLKFDMDLQLFHNKYSDVTMTMEYIIKLQIISSEPREQELGH